MSDSSLAPNFPICPCNFNPVNVFAIDQNLSKVDKHGYHQINNLDTSIPMMVISSSPQPCIMLDMYLTYPLKSISSFLVFITFLEIHVGGRIKDKIK